MGKLSRRHFLAASAAATAATYVTHAPGAEIAPTPTTRPADGAAGQDGADGAAVRVVPSPPMPPTLERWRADFHDRDGVQRIRPRESHENLPNPHIGTTTFQRFNGDPVNMDNRWDDRNGPEAFKPFDGNLANELYPQTTLAYCRWMWSRIEPEKGQYRWDIIDGALEAAAARGQRLQVRMQPYVGLTLPQWYLDTGGQIVAVPGRRRARDHDHNTEAYLKHWPEFIRAFGRRYDGHPNLESFDIAYGGSCGETGGNSTPETARRLVDAYLESFQKTQLISMLGTDGCAYAARKDRPIGWRADCFGDVRMRGTQTYPDYSAWNHMYEYYPEALFQCGVQDAWKTAPVIFETCWTVGHWFNEGWDIDWILEQGLAYHMSVFMPKSSYIPEQWRDKIDAFNRKIGYRFAMRQLLLPLRVRPNGRVRVNCYMENVGVAPIYRRYTFAMRFRQDERQVIVPLTVDPRTWLPGPAYFSEMITLPREFADGYVAVDVGLIDPQTQRPAVQLAIQGQLDDGWHPMTFIAVHESAQEMVTADIFEPVSCC